MQYDVNHVFSILTHGQNVRVHEDDQVNSPQYKKVLCWKKQFLRRKVSCINVSYWSERWLILDMHSF